MNALNALFNHPRAGILLLRWTLAILMVFHGWAKVRGGVGGIEGMLVANDQRLDAFLAELSRYRPGWLRCDPAVAGLRISGAFAIDDSDQTLRALSTTLPVRVVQTTRYWVTVVAL